ncbi:hypothetical protein MAR_027677 [Mya arenaria]|uniref:Uncharacterized protein n=1 Tax=Mya arenaria TaxID=6604 RepID=A0ABY7EX91_MYAAR|nr:hypothetical protein MAR_027677 [Mya arenaria]
MVNCTGKQHHHMIQLGTGHYEVLELISMYISCDHFWLLSQAIDQYFIYGHVFATATHRVLCSHGFQKFFSDIVLSEKSKLILVHTTDCNTLQLKMLPVDGGTTRPDPGTLENSSMEPTNRVLRWSSLK